MYDIHARFILAAENNTLLAFAGSANQLMFKTIHGYINTMIAGKPPSLDGVGQQAFAGSLYKKFSGLCRYKEAAAESEAPHIDLRGADAAKAMLADMSGAGVVGCDYPTVLKLLPFGFLLDSAERQKLQKLKNDVLAKSCVKTASEQDGTPDKPKQSLVDTRKMAKALFANDM